MRIYIMYILYTKICVRICMYMHKHIRTAAVLCTYIHILTCTHAHMYTQQDGQTVLNELARLNEFSYIKKLLELNVQI